MNKFSFLGAAVGIACLCVALEVRGDEASRRATLDELQRILPPSKPFETWLSESDELPPDFSSMPSIPLLPDPLVVHEGYPDAHTITTTAEWEAHRPELLEQFYHWILGTVPPPPDNVNATVLSDRHEQGATVREVELRFGPENKARLWLELLIPDGDGPFPVFMTQDNHRAWALIALRRGYIGCVYAGADSRDDTDTFLDAYPGYDWSRLMRRAWAAGRCIDYLESVPEANTSQIALTGHSRNGKQSLMAAAIDPRIAVVISSSSGAGGALPTRQYSEQYLGEGIENITRSFPEWFHPRWRFFVGHEDRLPVDLHELVALSAPRPCLLSTALNDGVESTWAMEQTKRTVAPVYALYGKEENVRIAYRPAGHETWPTIIERYVDWCDLHFGRGHVDFPDRLIHPYDWDAWAAAKKDETFHRVPIVAIGSSVLQDDMKAAVTAMLGKIPPTAGNPHSTYGEEPDHIEATLSRGTPPNDVIKRDVMFGDYINADVYLPASAKDAKDLPVVLWLHPINPCKGYVAAYRRGDQFFLTLARAGFAVFCYDQIGYGRRIEEVEGFYTKYPHWSLLGHMVRDARAALDAIGTLDYVDQNRIFVVGYGLGAMVGMHLGALDDRPDGYALVAGPQPWGASRSDTLNLDYWAKTTMLWPQAGLYVAEDMPYDVPELLANLAPKPAMVLTPELDWHVNVADVAAAVSAAQEVYKRQNASGAIEQRVPEDYNNLATPMQEQIIAWLREQTPSSNP